MKTLCLILFSGLILTAGCTGPCFYKYDTAIQQAQTDLNNCLDSPVAFASDANSIAPSTDKQNKSAYHLAVCECMRNKGYLQIDPVLLPEDVQKDTVKKIGIAGK